MIVTKIDQILLKTAEITGFSKEQVAEVIAHVLNSFYEFTMRPTHAGLRIPYLGAIRTSTKLLKWYMPYVIWKRYKNGKISKDRFQAYWKLRDLTLKDEQRRDFKERFNLEYNPPWRQDTDSTEGDSRSHED